MINEEIRAAILEAGYKAAKRTGSIKGSLFMLYEISKDWGESKEKIEFNANYLSEIGVLKWESSHGGMRITAEGVKEYERTHEVE